MAKLGKLFAWTAVVGAAVAGGMAYFKKKGDNDNTDNEKILNIDTDFTDDNRKYVSITINSKKAKDAMSDAKEVIGDFATKAKDKVTDIVGEENLENAKEAVTDFADDAKDWAKDSAAKAKDFAMDAKDKIKDGITRYTEDSYEFEEDDEETSDSSSNADDETSAASEAVDYEFFEEEITDEIND